ncbi:MAG: class I SAM-dependent methyltransferase [Bdellovibrionota bacterium]
MKSEFDQYAEKYEEHLARATGIPGQGADFFAKVKALRIRDIITSLTIAGKKLRVLDVGCGVGMTLRNLDSAAAELNGVDVSKASVERAKAENPAIQLFHYEGEKLPFADGSFDFVYTVNVLHHVPVDQRQAFIGEMLRVTRSNGHVAIFEHNPINPLTRKSVRDCPFDEGVTLLSRNEVRDRLNRLGAAPVRSDFILFLPFGAAWVYAFEKAIKWCPLGAQYFVLAKKS